MGPVSLISELLNYFQSFPHQLYAPAIRRHS
jgi:hypothetical protein